MILQSRGRYRESAKIDESGNIEKIGSVQEIEKSMDSVRPRTHELHYLKQPTVSYLT